MLYWWGPYHSLLLLLMTVFSLGCLFPFTSCKCFNGLFRFYQPPRVSWIVLEENLQEGIPEFPPHWWFTLLKLRFVLFLRAEPLSNSASKHFKVSFQRWVKQAGMCSATLQRQDLLTQETVCFYNPATRKYKIISVMGCKSTIKRLSLK